MYWPVGTPRVYVTATTAATARGEPVTSTAHDGLDERSPDESGSASREQDTGISLGFTTQEASIPELSTPITPGLRTPFTPGIKSVEHDGYIGYGTDTSQQDLAAYSHGLARPSEPLLALKVSRSGTLFAVITATSIAVWQTKVALTPMDPRAPILTTPTSRSRP